MKDIEKIYAEYINFEKRCKNSKENTIMSIHFSEFYNLPNTKTLMYLIKMFQSIDIFILVGYYINWNSYLQFLLYINLSTPEFILESMINVKF